MNITSLLRKPLPSLLASTTALTGLSLGTAFAQTSFTAGATVGTGQRAGGMAAADFDGDGILDFAVTTDGAGNQDLVELYRGTGGGAFAPAGVIFLPISSSPQGLAAADVDGDGDADLVVVLRDFAQVEFLRNLGAFQFVNGGSASTGGAESRVIVSADMDGDGDADFVVANRDSNNVSVILNQAGVLTFAGTTPAGAEPRDVAAGDFNGDGLMDVAAAAHDSRQVVILAGTGGGGLAQSQVLTVPAGARPDGLAAGDMDGDGDTDLVAATGDDTILAQNTVSIYLNGGGLLSGPIPTPTGGFDAGDVAVADFDLDGTLDVAVTNTNSANVSVLRGLGGAALGAPIFLVVAGQPDELVAADFDGNGSPDLGITRRQAAGVQFYLSDAGGSGPIGVNYCMANANSTGAPAAMTASGSNVLADNALTIGATSMPTGVFGIFLASRNTGFTPNSGGSSGNLCLGGAIGRFDQVVFQTGATGTTTLPVNLNAIPQPMGAAAASVGETWHFQGWFRDALAGMPTSNLTDGISVTIR